MPDPLRPTRHSRSPGATASPAPARIGDVPKLRLMSWSRSRGGGMAGGIARRGGIFSSPAPCAGEGREGVGELDQCREGEMQVDRPWDGSGGRDLSSTPVLDEIARSHPSG